jgi:hypothetical protein
MESPKLYNEIEALKQYVWKNYPEICKPHECLPSPEYIRDRLPNQMRDEYWRHVLECQDILERRGESDKKMSEETGGCVITMPILPQMNPSMVQEFISIFNEYKTKAFKYIFDKNSENIFIHRCGRCNRILVSPKSQQCLWCGFDWHIRA